MDRKSSFLLFGISEYSLRLFPLIVSLVSLPLFYKVAGYFLNKKAALISLFFFAISDSLIYYSIEIKQYTFDIFVSLLIYAGILKFIKDNNLTKKRIMILTLIGILAPWFSHPAVFTLASLGLVLLLLSIQKRNWGQTVYLLVIEICWLLSFAVNYFISTKVISESVYLLTIWKDFFIPIPSKSVGELYWYFKSIINFIYGPLHPSLSSDIIHLRDDRGTEEVKPVLQYFSAKRQSEDVLYVYYALIPAFQFYEAKYGLMGSHYIRGVSSREKLSGYVIDLNKLKQYKRVWVMFSHVIPVPSQTESEEQFFVDYLDGLGKRLDSFRATGASIYLYEIL